RDAQRLFEFFGGAAGVAHAFGEELPERDQDLRFALATGADLELDLVEAHHLRPVAERLKDAAPRVDGGGRGLVELEGALVALHRLVEEPELLFVELPELALDRGVERALGRT